MGFDYMGYLNDGQPGDMIFYRFNAHVTEYANLPMEIKVYITPSVEGEKLKRFIQYLKPEIKKYHEEFIKGNHE